MVGDAVDHLAQISLRIGAVELGGFDERVRRGGALAAGIGAGEQIVLAAERERADGALGGVVADLQGAVIEVARERRPAGAGITDRLGQLAAAGDHRERRIKEGREIVDQGASHALTNPLSLFGRQFDGGALDVQVPDALQRLARNRRVGGDMDVVEVSPHMRPARDLGHARGLPVGSLVKRPKAGIAVRLQEAMEVGQLRARVLGLAIGRIAIDDRWRCPAAERPFVAQVDPKPLGLAHAGRPHRHRGIVDVQLLGRQPLRPGARRAP